MFVDYVCFHLKSGSGEKPVNDYRGYSNHIKMLLEPQKPNENRVLLGFPMNMTRDSVCAYMFDDIFIFLFQIRCGGTSLAKTS